MDTRREEHYLAQWHTEKPGVLDFGRRDLFSVDRHTPFQLTPQEPRQELMKYINRWNARLALLRGGRGNTTAAEMAKDHLYMCSGYLSYLRRCGKWPEAPLQSSHSPYSGSRLPAADLSCVADLLSEQLVPLTAEERAALMRDYRELVVRNKYYYKLSTTAAVETLPPSWEKFGDAPPASSLVSPQNTKEEPFFLVEPWAKAHTDGWTGLRMGEGMFFNDRLHQITGASWASIFFRLRNHLPNWVR